MTTQQSNISDSTARTGKEGVAGGDLTVGWLLVNVDIPHKTNGVWLNGFERRTVSGLCIEPEYARAAGKLSTFILMITRLPLRKTSSQTWQLF